MSEPAVRTVEIVNERGLHARASAKFVKLAAAFDAEVRVTKDGQTVDARSIMGLMMLAAGPGSSIEIAAEGRQAEEAVAGPGRLGREPVRGRALIATAPSLADIKKSLYHGCGPAAPVL